MIKLIATDMDGTFLNDENQFPREFPAVFEQLKEKGIIFGAASGRQYYNLAERFGPLADDMLFIAENGSIVVYKDKEIFSNPMRPEAVKEVVEVARGIEGLHIVLCGKKAAYYENNSPEVLKEIDKYYTSRKHVTHFSEVEDDILKISLLDFQGAETHSYPSFKKFQGDLQVTVGGYVWLDIMNEGSNKGIAMQRIQERLGISPNDTMVFGDYLNDLELMEKAYYSYAMANAHDKIKEVSRFVTKWDNNESGVIETIKEAVLASK
ncbi:Cof-type HAD-IIB family hydrolase [Bacillus testis]|uniref:Cof-type HAD-IIB family hydrolase n=1 Tax=Bacillus testis TaxID=1622072 RepID=UPI00067F0557|nr:Cof-type HAD-IIB family hydrolase [Bacillus testis]